MIYVSKMDAPLIKSSEAQRKASRKYYQKMKESKHVQMGLYYEKNKEHLKAKRRARYAAQKAQTALVISA